MEKLLRIEQLEYGQIDEALALFVVQLKEHSIEVESASVRSVIEKIISDTAHGFILVAMNDAQKIVGVILGSAFLGIEHGGESGWIEELYVLPQWRKLGIGTLLLKSAVRIARERGWRALDLEVESDHQQVISLYQRHDFQPQTRSRFCLKLEG